MTFRAGHSVTTNGLTCYKTRWGRGWWGEGERIVSIPSAWFQSYRRESNPDLRNIGRIFHKNWQLERTEPRTTLCLTVILRGRAGYELIITNEAVGRVGYYQLISGKSEKNNCFSKFLCNSLDFFGWNLLKSWHFLYRRRREKNFSDLQNFSTRNSPSVFPYLVKLNDNGSYHGLKEPIRKLENHYP